MFLGVAGAAQTPNTEDFRPAQKSCIKQTRSMADKAGGGAPAFLKAFPCPRGKPDLKNTPPTKIRPDCLQVPPYRPLSSL